MDNSNFDFTATYSVEDDKLRLYFPHRIDAEQWAWLKEEGFKWAPKQELLYTHWTPKREDVCYKLAGDIEAEQTTMIERAEDRIARFEGYATNRQRDAEFFSTQAQRIGERFAMGQPILVGHHSERSARRDQGRIDCAMAKSVEQIRTANYWNYRIVGVAQHANQLACERTRVNRIERLLKEFRDIQRTINGAYLGLEKWGIIDAVECVDERKQLTEHFSGDSSIHGVGNLEFYYGRLTVEEVIKANIQNCNNIINSPGRVRWLMHLLNRLAYERGELGEVPLYDGNITAAVLQTFARSQGAEQPKAKKEDDMWVLSSDVPLPIHFGVDGLTMAKNVAEWCEFMQKMGYTVPAKKTVKPPILNFKVHAITSNRKNHKNEFSTLEQIEMSKAEYMAKYEGSRWVETSKCGNFRFKVFSNHWSKPKVAVYITDSKAHPVPESDAVILTASVPEKALSEAETVEA